jgi:D-cysteine desulfhydrase
MKAIPANIVNLSAATVDPVKLPLTETNNVRMDTLRLDKIHPVISGNKWFKLKYPLQAALSGHCSGLITFGGAYSNHILATAYAARSAGLAATGIIRGEVPKQLSPTLMEASEYGMQLRFVSRPDYSQRAGSPVIREIMQQYPGAYLIEEGGSGELGILGAGEILSLVNKEQYTHIVCAMGTGTMLLGIAGATLPRQQVIGIPVLKGFDNWLQANPTVSNKRTIPCNIAVFPGYHFGGYAKKNQALFGFMNDFYTATGIPTDFVYSGKLFFSVLDLIANGYFPPGSRLLVIHCGGLQGNRSLPAGTLVFD